MIPMLLPTIMSEHGVNGATAGTILALPWIIAAFLLPYVNTFIKKIGLEKSIFYGNVGFVVSMLAIGWGVTA